MARCCRLRTAISITGTPIRGNWIMAATARNWPPGQSFCCRTIWECITALSKSRGGEKHELVTRGQNCAHTKHGGISLLRACLKNAQTCSRRGDEAESEI